MTGTHETPRSQPEPGLPEGGDCRQDEPRKVPARWQKTERASRIRREADHRTDGNT